MKKLLAGGMFVALCLATVPSAVASTHHPKGEMAQFGECPLSVAAITNCVLSVSNRGAFKVGNKSLPLVNPITLQGGAEGSGDETKFYGAESGDTLSRTPQPVPGGLAGVVAPTSWPKFLQAWLNNGISEGLVGVTATIELAGPSEGLTNIKLNTENLILETGIALDLPVKLKLSNPLLGSNCYVGSDSKPIQISFTTGKSGSLTGAAGEFAYNKSFTLITVSGGRLVSGTFAAPVAVGCGGLFSSLVDPMVNSILGLPAGPRSNTATLEGNLQAGASSAVKASG